MGIKLIIIGGVAGGATAAARARRLDEQAEIIMFERGEYISFANCGLPYYVGGVIPKRESLLVTTAQAMRDRYRVDVRTRQEVTAIHRDRKTVEVHDLAKDQTSEERYDKIILSPGAEPIRPPLPGIDLEGIHTIRNIPDIDCIKEGLTNHKPESAVVVGGGFIGLEMAENLVHLGIKTSIVEMLDQVMPPLDPEMAAYAQAHLKDQGVDLILGDGVQSFRRENDLLTVATASGREISCGLVILSIGVRPESGLAKDAGLELGERGHIKVDASLRTSDPDIFAAGDAVEVTDRVTGMPTATALAGPANKQARIAADNAMGRRSIFRGTLGTAVVKLFQLTIASTGASEKTLKRLGRPYLACYHHGGSHASYYPGATNTSIKLVFAPNDGKILGAQIVGRNGVDKRIDVLATAIHGNMTVFDLEELELAYAPPYGAAKDPINMIGFVAANILKGDMESITWSEKDQINMDTTEILDVRTPMERKILGEIPGSRMLPIDDLRKELENGGLDRNKEYVTYCAVGQRAYLATRILDQHGYLSRNLSGGYFNFLSQDGRLMSDSPQVKAWLEED
jgi:NADPH-dependent 2,4-dienoyl-CoA reductase/sulfur reductase-like enzyme/rhodanese-related sulfurtransferase